MNEVDVAILFVVGLSSLFGIWRGLVKEVLSLLTWVAALVIARIYSEAFSSFLVNMIDSENVRYVTAFAILFIVIMMLGTLATHLMSKLLTITGLKLLDRLLGGLFGVLRGLIIVLVIMFVSNVFVSETERWQQSILVPYGMDMIDWSQMFIGDLDTGEPELDI